MRGKRIISIAMIIVMALSFCSCKKRESIEPDLDKQIKITISNETDDRLKGFGITYYIGSRAVGSTAVSSAEGGPLGNGEDTIYFKPSEFEKTEDLHNFAMKLSVTEMSGAAMECCCLSFPVAAGEEYKFILHFEDDCYSLYSVMNNGIGWSSERDYGPYTEIIRNYRNACVEGWDPEACMAKDVNYMIGLMDAENRGDNIGYLFTDLDGDGVNELLIGTTENWKEEFVGKLIYDIYTVIDEKPVLVFGSMERSRLYSGKDDNTFAWVGSSGWDDSVDDIMTFKENGLEKIGENMQAEDYSQLPLMAFSR